MVDRIHILMMKHKVNSNNEKKLYFLNQTVTPDTEICRYMGFDVFLQLLGGVFYVPRKQSFLDTRESGKIPMKFKFGFQNISNPEFKSLKTNEEKHTETTQYLQNLVRSQLLLTSCWACNYGEDYLMWKSYTNDTIGVCVRTTIDKLMQAINYDDKGYIPICSPMTYRHTTPNIDFMESMFTKEPFYISENELRIYFIPKEVALSHDWIDADNNSVKQLLIETSEYEEKLLQQKEEKYPKHVTFEINPAFIDSIILSPFIKPNTYQYFLKALNGYFADFFKNGIKVNHSEITIK